jgi:hypothetical protein
VPALVAAVLASALAPSAHAHTLTLQRAHTDTLFYVRGIAYAFDVSADPTVRCVRSGGSPHTVLCSWRFRRLDHALGTEGVCTGTVRVYLFDGSLRLHRTIVRRRRCVTVST